MKAFVGDLPSKIRKGSARLTSYSGQQCQSVLPYFPVNSKKDYKLF